MLKNVKNNEKFKNILDGPTDGPTDRPTDRPRCRVACTRLKNERGSLFSVEFHQTKCKQRKTNEKIDDGERLDLNEAESRAFAA